MIICPRDYSYYSFNFVRSQRFAGERYSSSLYPQVQDINAQIPNGCLCEINYLQFLNFS